MVARGIIANDFNWYLQLGHRLSAVEILEIEDVTSGQERLQLGHRLSAVEIGGKGMADNGLHSPSIGPPPFGSGNSAATGGELHELGLLQLGHRLSAVEI